MNWSHGEGTDDIIDYRELTLLLMSTGMFSARDILQYFTFPLLDTDGNGEIDKNELARHLGYILLPAAAASSRVEEGEGEGDGDFVGGGGATPPLPPTAISSEPSPRVLVRRNSENALNAIDKIFSILGTTGGIIEPQLLGNLADPKKSYGTHSSSELRDLYHFLCSFQQLTGVTEDAITTTDDRGNFRSADSSSGGGSGGGGGSRISSSSSSSRSSSSTLLDDA